jgi:hypothetical protein
MRSRKGVAAGVSVAILVPTITLVSVLLLGLVMQANKAQLAGVNAADLQAEEVKKYLRASIIRGASNQSLVNLYAAGKLPIHVDYLLATAYNGTVLAEKNGLIISLNPGDNVTLVPSQLDPRLAPYDGDYWRMRREVKALILHTSDGNTFYLSWGPWGGMLAATFSTNTATTSTAYTTTTTTHTVSVSVIRTIYMPSTETRVVTVGYPTRFTTSSTQRPLFISVSCTVSATYVYRSLGGTYEWYDPSVSCNVSVSGQGPPYSYSMRMSAPHLSCSNSGSSTSTSFSTGCSRNGYAGASSGMYNPLTVRVDVSVTGGGRTASGSGYCYLYPGYNYGTSSCSLSFTASG